MVDARHRRWAHRAAVVLTTNSTAVWLEKYEGADGVDGADGADGTITPFLEARFSGIQTAIGFTTVEQQALAAGGGSAIGAAICLIPGVGWAACAAIGVVVSVATTYIFKNGICSGGRKLWWYDVKGRSTVGCRSPAPF